MVATIKELMPFKEWLKQVYGLSHVELMEKNVNFQQMVHNHYTDYIAIWEKEQHEEA